MRLVASAGGTERLSDADRRALVGFDRFILRRTGTLDDGAPWYRPVA